jgi:hypothetical protein
MAQPSQVAPFSFQADKLQAWTSFSGRAIWLSTLNW